MENTELVKEEITPTTLSTVTLKIPLQVSLISSNDSSKDFTSSIDEIGQILLTPTDTETTFESAKIIDIEEESDVDLSDVIYIQADMLQENENKDIDVTIDEIGQCIIYPVSKENTFVSATINDSLNLVTEEMQVIEYIVGYKLRNTGDGWDVLNNSGEILETGLATLEEAKVFVCREELKRLKGESVVVESVEDSSEDNIDTDHNTEQEVAESEEETPLQPNVEAEVIEESIITAVKDITNNFTESIGGLSCSSITEKDSCMKLLESRYNNVAEKTLNEQFIIMYGDLKHD